MVRESIQEIALPIGFLDFLPLRRDPICEDREIYVPKSLTLHVKTGIG